MPLLLLWSLTIGTVGKVLLGVTVLRVHSRITKEHKIDGQVLSEMKHEKWAGIIGILLMVIGYLLEMVFYLGGPFSF